ncbi:hypothetical protein BCR44DRAFT_69335 [Catenaria anguillulae PL171]|uniref:t-SNARE coiled-coil homology domain-containing protein n=1 Tax=Catenaria anguillulae PL171 TaxID=765915 RepID=A0A1Y2HM76_9FUNG|nr:hypothetical protein BCR44DRAFT_69335 [Catenaria anguillulae PL171]
MSEELQEYDDQLKEIVTSMTTCLETEVSKLQGAARLEKCEYLKNRINRGRQLVKSINVELRELPSDKRLVWQEKAKAYDAQLNKLQQDVNWAVTSAERDGQGGGRVKGVNEMTAKEMTQAGLEIQKESLQATSRTKAVLATTIQMGTETMDVLKQQTDQIQGINDKVDQVESNLKRADKQLRAFLRKMATDRIIMVFVFLIVLGIVGAILVNVLRGSKATQAIDDTLRRAGINATVIRLGG